ncbi:hypothetical protein QBC41DRAFT_312732 [Cercophora samala]|uniref:Extracellular membrane protein CFEM domain-containing protein n=1 Tax=Cercophora samala TaxID=330535 RepID=A0AA39ZKK2_9PEZI|nr:hypothetical protein QBC41DRAFT_312732 [Cercophora samala]
MLFVRHVGLALAGSVYFLSLVEHTASTRPAFEFPPCVGGCILDSDCLPSKWNCMCRRAKGDFLEKVLRCMGTNCHADLRDYEESFLDPLEDGCDERNQDIPSSKLKVAKALAKSLLSEPSITTTIVTASFSKTEPKSSTVETRPASAVQEGETSTPTTTSEANQNDHPNSTSVSRELAASSTQPATPSPDPNPEPIPEPAPPPVTDTSPFTNSNIASSGSQARSAFAILGICLAAAVLLTEF